jgi:hypothetical protein
MVAWRPVAIALAVGLSHPVWGDAATCSAQSGEHTNPLVELYVSARCVGCPAAERWLAGLGGELPGMVALVWRTDEAGYLPGKPRDLRAPRLTTRQRLALEDRPVVLLQAHESPDWGTDAFRRRLAGIAGRPARVQLALRATPSERSLRVEAGLQFIGEGVREASLYVAAYAADGAVGGSRLAHAWQGPWLLSRSSARLVRSVPPLPGKRPDQSGVAAFVQDRRTGEVLQALTLPPCPP